MSATTLPEHDARLYNLETFSIRRRDDDPRPGVVWKGTADLTVAAREATGGGDEDATVMIRINVDHGEFDIVAAEASGYDQLQLLDRAIAAMTEIRAAFQNLTGSTDGWCLTRSEDGAACRLRGAHDDHAFQTAGPS